MLIYSILAEVVLKRRITFNITVEACNFMFSGGKIVQPIYNVLVVEHYCPLVFISTLTSVSLRKVLRRYGEMKIAKTF